MSSPLIILVAADKGGVGKTTVSRALMDYVTRQGVVARAFDTEPGDGVLRRFHADAEILAVDTVPGQMRMVDSATSEAVTVVDCRAGALTPIMAAFARIKLMSDVRDGILRLVVLHVVGPNVASEGEVAKVAAGLDGAKIVQVLNYVDEDATFRVDASTGMAVPHLDQEAAQTVDQLGVSFARFAVDPKQSRVLRGYIRAWEEDVFAGFDRVGIGSLLKE